MDQFKRYMTYKQRLGLNFIIVFAIFGIVIAFFQYQREKGYKITVLENTLTGYSDVVHNSYLEGDITEVKNNMSLLPKQLRVTLIEFDGVVSFDNSVLDISLMANHKDREEIKNSIAKGVGSDIRSSATLGREYFYFAKKYDDIIVRTSLPYSVDVKDLLKPDNYVLFIILIVFAASLGAVVFVSDRLGLAISRLKEFSLQTYPDKEYRFPKGELGDIGSRLADLFAKNRKVTAKLNLEREKFILHLQNSGEGLAFFSKGGEVIYLNSKFIQYSKMIATSEEFDPEDPFAIPFYGRFSKIISENRMEGRILSDMYVKNGMDIKVDVVVFDDGSFEFIVNDLTKQEKNKRIKYEMTQNIAHELKTPVAAVKGYIETMISIDLKREKREYILDRMASQVNRLTDLVNDIAFITKTEEAPHLFSKELIDMNELIDSLVVDKDIPVDVNISSGCSITGNRSLIHSIFQNLVDNAIKYVDGDLKLTINKFHEDDEFIIFSVYDNGQGVPDSHLNRLFERFYRVDKGRDRQRGGTGLGLSIVKNAVLFHDGEISAKNRVSGGLEFVFSLKK